MGAYDRRVRVVKEPADRADRRLGRAGAGELIRRATRLLPEALTGGPALRSRVARRGTSASGPHQSAASTRSPSTHTHSASAPAGISAWSMPGASFTTVRGTRVGQAGDEVPRRRVGVRVEDPPPGAGPAPGRVAERGVDPGQVERRGVAALTVNRSASPAASAFAAAIAAVSGSASTAYTRMPARAAASASAPMPQPRSARVVTPAARSRAARRSATARRVACSSPARVRNIPAAAAPNLPTARRRRSAWVSAAAARSGRDPGRAERGGRSQRVAAGHRGRRGERGRPLGGTQRGELVEIHAPIVPARFAGDTEGDVLALSLTEC